MTSLSCLLTPYYINPTLLNTTMNPNTTQDPPDTGGDEVTDLERLRLTLESTLVRRFHAAPSVKPQPVGQHCVGVAFIATYIYGGQDHVPKEVLLACLAHDQEEILTGDIPFHAKRDFPKMRELCSEMETIYNQSFLVRGLQLTPLQCFIVKLADQLEGMFWTTFYENGHMIFRAWEQSMQGLLKSDFYQRELSAGEKSRVEDLFNQLTNPESEQY